MIVKLPLELNSIKEEGYHIFVTIQINGIPARMLLDTGASRTVFDVSLLKAMQDDISLEENEDKAVGLGSSTVDNFIATVNTVELGNLKLHNYQAGVLDLTHVNLSYAGIEFEAIAGVLGSDILVKYKAVIDLSKKEMLLVDV